MNKELIEDINLILFSDNSKRHFPFMVSVKAIKEIINTCEQSQLETIVQWAIKQGFSTGHADTIESLLDELELEIKEIREKANK